MHSMDSTLLNCDFETVSDWEIISARRSDAPPGHPIHPRQLFKSLTAWFFWSFKPFLIYYTQHGHPIKNINEQPGGSEAVLIYLHQRTRVCRAFNKHQKCDAAGNSRLFTHKCTLNAEARSTKDAFLGGRFPWSCHVCTRSTTTNRTVSKLLENGSFLTSL